MSLWEKIDNTIDTEIAEFNATTVNDKIQQIIAGGQQIVTGKVEGDPVGTTAKVRMADQRLVTAYVGNRTVSDGDTVTVFGGRIQ